MTKKRANGEGSVYRRKDGRVVGEWTDAHGQTKYMTSKTMNKNQMKAAVRKKLEDRDNGLAFDAENLTVAEYIDRWLESTQDTVSLRTWQRAESAARLHIIPTLGKTKLDKLSAMQQDSITICRTYETVRVGGGLGMPDISKYLAPPRDVPKTLKAGDQAHLPPLPESESYVKRGDRVIEIYETSAD